MNIFRELVDELKEENLLEQTVIEPEQEGAKAVETHNDGEKKKEAENRDVTSQPLKEAEVNHPGEVTTDFEASEQPIEMPEGDMPLAPPDESIHKTTESTPDSQESTSDSQADNAEIADEEPKGIESSPKKPEPLAESAAATESEESNPETDKKKKPSNSDKVHSPEEEKKFYRQRAMDEVTGLQLVEHVLSGVEREQMKSVPKSFDDFAVKRALHDFLKVADDVNSPAHAKAEFQLMQETENWCSALSRRDRNISVAHLRRYCETTKPRLTSQALISLARFYRNSPYSESVRSKFDLVFTKLFSKEQGGDLRSVVFKNEELVKYVQELYADWSCIPLYSTDEDDAELLLTALKFEDFIKEAESAKTFDELVKADFFKRLKLFKSGTNENFFAPVVVAAAIESNVKVGNRYVELIELERHRSAGTEIGDKYGVTYDTYISESTSKTLELIEMLRTKKPQATVVPKPTHVKPEPIFPEPLAAIDPEPDPKRFSVAGGANKWLIVATVVVLIVTVWLFLQGSVEFTNEPQKGSITADELSLAATPLGDHIHSARISRNTMYGITRDSWSGLSLEERRNIVTEAVELGKTKGFAKVQLLNSEGKSMAFGSGSRVTVY